MVRYISVFLCLAACTLTPQTAAQSGTPHAAGAPAPESHCAQGEVLTIPADGSAWTRYQPWRDEGVGDWRRANALVAHIGGWRVYARETAPCASIATSSKVTP
jgi:hypothetical protein